VLACLLMALTMGTFALIEWRGSREPDHA
jgi:hypothetical protein